MIGKQSIEISFESLDDAFGVQDRIAEIYYEKLQPQMEILFDEICDNDVAVVFDRLEVDCGMLNQDNWQGEWVETTLRKLKDQLRQADKRTRLVTGNQHEFFFYLGHGYLPWNSRVGSLVQFEKELVIDQLFVSYLAETVGQYPDAARRLVHNFSAHWVQAIVEKLVEEAGFESEVRKEVVKHVLPACKAQPGIVEKLIVFLSSPDRAAKELKIHLENRLEELADKRHKPGIENKDEAIYINHAGLVIFHPFFRQFFEQLKLTKNDQWIDDQKMQQAVIIMQHLATGLDEFEEFELVLTKLLCGLQPGDVITEDLAITSALREASEELILEVIGHWSALKNTGPAAFRNTFIQRHAKLSRVDNGWLLQVERHAVDILLGSLPWGIGVIKLPWMNEILFTEWA